MATKLNPRHFRLPAAFGAGREARKAPCLSFRPSPPQPKRQEQPKLTQTKTTSLERLEVTREVRCIAESMLDPTLLFTLEVTNKAIGGRNQIKKGEPHYIPHTPSVPKTGTNYDPSISRHNQVVADLHKCLISFVARRIDEELSKELQLLSRLEHARRRGSKTNEQIGSTVNEGESISSLSQINEAEPQSESLKRAEPSKFASENLVAGERPSNKQCDLCELRRNSTNTDHKNVMCSCATVAITEILYFDRDFGQMCLLSPAALADIIRSEFTKRNSAEPSLANKKSPCYEPHNRSLEVVGCRSSGISLHQSVTDEWETLCHVLARLRDSLCCPDPIDTRRGGGGAKRAVGHSSPKKCDMAIRAVSHDELVASMLACGLHDLRITYDAFSNGHMNTVTGISPKPLQRGEDLLTSCDDTAVRVTIGHDGHIRGAELLQPLRAGGRGAVSESNKIIGDTNEDSRDLLHHKVALSGISDKKQFGDRSEPLLEDESAKNGSEGESRALSRPLSFYASVRRQVKKRPLEGFTTVEPSELKPIEQTQPASSDHTPTSDEDLMCALELLQESNRSSQPRANRSLSSINTAIPADGEVNFNVSTGTSTVSGSRVIFYGEMRPNSSSQSDRRSHNTIPHHATSSKPRQNSTIVNEAHSTGSSPFSSSISSRSSSTSSLKCVVARTPSTLLKRRRTLPNMPSVAEIPDQGVGTLNLLDVTAAPDVFDRENETGKGVWDKCALSDSRHNRSSKSRSSRVEIVEQALDDEALIPLRPAQSSTNESIISDKTTSSGFTLRNVNARRETVAPYKLQIELESFATAADQAPRTQRGPETLKERTLEVERGKSTYLRVAITSHFRPVTPAELSIQQKLFGAVDKKNPVRSSKQVRGNLDESMEVPEEVRQIQNIWKRAEEEEALEREKIKNVLPWNIPLARPENEGYSLAESAFFQAYLEKHPQASKLQPWGADDIQLTIDTATSTTGPSSSRSVSELSFVSRVWRAGGHLGSPRRSSALSIETGSSSFSQQLNTM